MTLERGKSAIFCSPAGPWRRLHWKQDDSTLLAVVLARINQNRSRKRASTYSLPEWPLFSWKNLISSTPSGESLEIIIWCLDSSGKGALLSRPPTRSTPPIRTGLNFARQLDFFTQPPFLMVSISSGNAFPWSNIISSLSAESKSWQDIGSRLRAPTFPWTFGPGSLFLIPNLLW